MTDTKMPDEIWAESCPSDHTTTTAWMYEGGRGDVKYIRADHIRGVTEIVGDADVGLALGWFQDVIGLIRQCMIEVTSSMDLSEDALIHIETIRTALTSHAELEKENEKLKSYIENYTKISSEQAAESIRLRQALEAITQDVHRDEHGFIMSNLGVDMGKLMKEHAKEALKVGT